LEKEKIMANDVSKAFKDWKEWAKTDWKEFSVFFVRKWGIEAFLKVEAEFASQMSVSTHCISQLTDFATGKLMEKAASASIANVFSIGDFLAKVVGFGYVTAWDSIQGKTRENPIKCIGTSVFSDEYTFNEDQLKDYVQFILYWYPKDVKAGFYGFRYGGVGSLRSEKKLPEGLYYGR
jgi:hypothetical protein